MKMVLIERCKNGIPFRPENLEESEFRLEIKRFCYDANKNEVRVIFADDKMATLENALPKSVTVIGHVSYYIFHGVSYEDDANLPGIKRCYFQVWDIVVQENTDEQQ